MAVAALRALLPLLAGQATSPNGEISVIEKYASGSAYAADAAVTIAHAKKLGGDPDQVLAAVQGWYDAAAEIDASEETMFDAYNNLRVDWEGPAFQAFEKYMERNREVAKETSDALANIGIQLADTYLAVVDSCERRDTAIATAAKAITDSVTTIFGWSLEDDQQINVAIKRFIDDYAAIKKDISQVVATYRANMIGLEGAALSIGAPGEFPEAASNRKKWEKTK
jgi:uncharacterized protein YukE